MACTYKENKVTFILTNFIIVLIGFILGILIIAGLIPQYKAGFICYDPKLMYPYTGDTVTNATATCIVIIIPPILILISEAMLYICDYDSFEKKEFFKCMKTGIFWCIEYLIILAFANVILYVFKYICGEPRPDFMDTCKPDVCKNSTLPSYYQHYECTNTDLPSSVVESSATSFCSGHTMNSVYCAAFMFWYFQKRIYHYSPRFVSLALQIIFIVFAIVCSMTRITDHRHHWWDVVCGAILGALSAIFAIKEFCNNFVAPKFSSTKMFLTNKNNNLKSEVIEIN